VVVMTSQMVWRNRSKCQPFFSFCWVRDTNVGRPIVTCVPVNLPIFSTSMFIRVSSSH
jgi:hypothetical protein